MKTLHELWVEYRDKMYPPDKCKLHPIQEQETHRAFVGGCSAALGHISKITDLPDDEAIQAMKDFEKSVMIEILQIFIDSSQSKSTEKKEGE